MRETSHNTKKGNYKHKRDLIKGNANNTMVKYNLETNYNFDFGRSLNLVSFPTATQNQRPGFSELLPYLVKFVQKN